MQATHCPVCYEPLEIREVSPCMDCGCHPTEVEHARQGKHTYAEYRIFGDLSLVLCNFCQVDFTSYDPTFFNLPREKRIGLGEKGFQFVREVQPVVTKGKCCPQCRLPLPFLEFVVRAREFHDSL